MGGGAEIGINFRKTAAERLRICEREKIALLLPETLDGRAASCYNFQMRGQIPRILPCVGVNVRFSHKSEYQEEFPVITELASQEKVIGVKQSRKMIREGRARQVYLACDADPSITDPVARSCAEANIPVRSGFTMAQLGQACRITVGASVVAVL